MNSITFNLNPTKWELHLTINLALTPHEYPSTLTVIDSNNTQTIFKKISESEWACTTNPTSSLATTILLSSNGLSLSTPDAKLGCIEIDRVTIIGKNIDRQKIVMNIENIPETPIMTQACIALYQGFLKNCNVLIEYGSGGSTNFAINNNVPKIISTESDINWYIALLISISKKGAIGSIIPSYVNIGPTGAWGTPIDSSETHNYPTYSVLPWEKSRELKLEPDVVLIDGRFRVSCFLTSLILAKHGCILIFEDYVNRPQYHVVEELIKPFLTLEPQACFLRPEKIDLSKAYTLAMNYCTKSE